MICILCRNFFKVWPGVDERLALETKNPLVNPNWSKGGNRSRKPNALLLKATTDELNPNQDEVHAGPEVIGDGDLVDDRPAVDRPDNEDVDDAPENVSFEIGNEDRVDGMEDSFDDYNNDDDDDNDDDDYEDYNSDDDNDDDNDDNNGDNDENNDNPSTMESIAEPYVVDANFLKGKILLLPVTDGSVENACCAICHQLADENAEPITLLLENRLRLNPILSSEETFGIAFDFYSNNVDMQLVCTDCLATSKDSEDGQTVFPKVYTIDFHKKYGNLSEFHADNVTDLFNAASSLSMSCVKELRDRIAELENKMRFSFFNSTHAKRMILFLLFLFHTP